MIEKYQKEKHNIWNHFVAKSKNGTFLFDRRYMDYHEDRFDDHSLMIFRKDKLYALLPANRVNNTLYSHQGLTFGGFIMDKNNSTSGMLEIVKETKDYLLSHGINEIIYKPTPYIYHHLPSQEDMYAFFRCCEIQTVGCNISSAIFQNNKIKFESSRKGGIVKALRAELHISESKNYSAFWNILKNNMSMKYKTKPVHTVDEIKLLHSHFPDNIKLYLVYRDKTVLGGTVLYLTHNVVHTQYISASLEGKKNGALDFLFDHLINKLYTSIPCFDFGHSTEQMGKYLNEQLIFQKEGFGGRGVTYNTYKMTLNN